MNSIQIRSFLSDASVFIHYTDEKGLRGIQQNGVIRPNYKGFVYLSQTPFSPENANMNLFLAQTTHEGRGTHMIVMRLDPGLNPTKMSDLYEFRVNQSIRLDQHELLYSGKNLFDL